MASVAATAASCSGRQNNILDFVEFLDFDQCNTETRVEFLDFDQCKTETRAIPPIPLILGRPIRIWC